MDYTAKQWQKIREIINEQLTEIVQNIEVEQSFIVELTDLLRVEAKVDIDILEVKTLFGQRVLEVLAFTEGKVDMHTGKEV